MTSMVLLCMGLAGTAWAADATEAEVVDVPLGGSTVVDVRGSLSQATLTDPTIADVSSTRGGLLVVGRRLGETHLVLSGTRGREVRVIKVSLPATAIRDELVRLFPREDIMVRGVGGSLVLSGTVGNVHAVQHAQEVALGYLNSPAFSRLGLTPRVINMLQVRNQHQVLLEVKFAEVNRRSLREIGVNLLGIKNDGRVGAAVGRSATEVAGANGFMNPETGMLAGADKLPLVAKGSVGSLFLSTPDGTFPFAATLNLLATRDLSKTLAEPRLVAMSGQRARFMAGGEFPYEKSNGFSTTVEFKSFGIELDFTPVVLEDGTIQLKTTSAVSAPDPTLTIVVNGVTTQGFKRRSSETTVRLRDGHSFAIAGLLSSEMENLITKVPGLGDIPILGTLFSSKSFNRRETELLVLVTARLVSPMDSHEVPLLPGEGQINDPNDLQLFLLNLPDPAQPKPITRPKRQPSGKVGFLR